ncbi:hypothetical protein ACAG96_06550 [Candidatus Izemoplasma sp. B36]
MKFEKTIKNLKKPLPIHIYGINNIACPQGYWEGFRIQKKCH